MKKIFLFLLCLTLCLAACEKKEPVASAPDVPPVEEKDQRDVTNITRDEATLSLKEYAEEIKAFSAKMVLAYNASSASEAPMIPSAIAQLLQIEEATVKTGMAWAEYTLEGGFDWASLSEKEKAAFAEDHPTLDGLPKERQAVLTVLGMYSADGSVIRWRIEIGRIASAIDMDSEKDASGFSLALCGTLTDYVSYLIAPDGDGDAMTKRIEQWNTETDAILEDMDYYVSRPTDENLVEDDSVPEESDPAEE